MNTLSITGYTRDCNCEHCGRPLKLGVVTPEKGTIGADCFVRLIQRDTKRYSGNGKPSAEMVKQYALIIAKGLEYAARQYGYRASSFVFQTA
ncbi:hypothetical protein [Thauera butanivorans]|uniref:hypothetical protein n=1 Tax=Thauera butanivorans TaxID=86174 RepID=UPI0008383D6F|nr:hypothetical protein [Thauera butanivorans]